MVRMLSIMRCTRLGAMPNEGSSRRSSLGRLTRARETASICRWPPLREPAGWPSFSFRAGKISQAKAMLSLPAPLPPLAWRAKRRFSSTLMRGKTLRVSGTRAIPRSTRSWGAPDGRLWPAYWRVPAAIGCRPKTVRRKVVLPAPLWPSRATMVCGAMVMLTPCSTSLEP